MNRNKCAECKFYKRIYRQFRYRYFREPMFYCTAKEEILEEFCGCKNRQTERKRCDLSAARIKKVENDVLRIGEILKDR